ncbi:MAG TPA: GldG family protein [Polyangiaceae bacterium]
MAAKKKHPLLLSLNWGRGIELTGVFGVILLAGVFNFLSGRHFKRWDWTESQRYTLTPATLDTLRSLPDKVEVWVLLGSGDPLEQSVKQMLDAYTAETTKLDVHSIDPDRDPIALEDVHRRFGIESGHSADGRVVTDAILVLAHGDKHWFLTPSDMFKVSNADDVTAKPREEQAITGAIRNVLGAEKTKLCFTVGHGEGGLKEGGEEGLAFLDEILGKDNYENVSVDTTAPNAHEPFKDCGVVVIAAPQAPFTPDEAERLKTYLMLGGNAFLAASPINAATPTGMAPLGLDAAFAPFGIGFDDDLVIEPDGKVAIPDSRGTRFIAEVRSHAVTSALVAGTEGVRDPPRVVVQIARSLEHVTPEGAATATDLLASGPSSFAVSSIAGAAQWLETPQKQPQDRSGPLVFAMASERPKLAPSAPHGPRVVVLGTGYIMQSENWRQPGNFRGGADLVESSIAWLASKPEILDVPTRPQVAAGIRITEESRDAVFRYVVFFMPLAVLLLAAAVAFWRRSSERAPRKRVES